MIRETPSPKASAAAVPVMEGAAVGKIRALKTNGYGFIEGNDKAVRFFHLSDLINRADWDRMRIGNVVRFIAHESAKGPAALQVGLITD